MCGEGGLPDYNCEKVVRVVFTRMRMTGVDPPTTGVFIFSSSSSEHPNHILFVFFSSLGSSTSNYTSSKHDYRGCQCH